jgi:arginine utilization protein RocB
VVLTLLDCRNDVLSFTKQLTQIESIVNTNGEKEMADTLYTMISSFDYFKENPEKMVKDQTINDDFERNNILAFVEGTKELKSKKSVILLGHIDTVGIEDYQRLQGIACDPDPLKKALLLEEQYPAAVKDQLESDDWLFGRGVLDMKSGVASNLYLLKYYSEHPEQLAGNLIFIAACDEEDSSHGILSAVHTLKEWKSKYGFDYIASINADFVSPRYEGDHNRYIYKGTVGKLLPSFYITGAETHVGSSFEGLDPNFIAAELTRHIDYNPDFCNQAHGETTMPPVALKQTDLKPFYTVQTALSAYVYYNFFVYSWTPAEVLTRLKQTAADAFDRALILLKQRYTEYCNRSGEPYKDLPWNTRVFTYEEIYGQLLQENGGEFEEHMDHLKASLLNDIELDSRMFSLRVVEECWKWMKDKSPTIILFYSTLYSPRVDMQDKSHNEIRLSEALEAAIDKISPSYAQPIVTRHFFPYISDMSFINMSDNEEEIEAVVNNTPAWGSKINIDFNDIRSISIPVINIGPYGHDAHKKYERVEITYSTEVVPNLTNEVIRSLLS